MNHGYNSINIQGRKVKHIICMGETKVKDVITRDAVLTTINGKRE